MTRPAGRARASRCDGRSRSGGRCRSGGRRRTSGWGRLAGLALCLGVATASFDSARAQGASTPGDAQAAAEAAREASEQAQRELEAARESLEQAEARAAQREREAEALEARAAEPEGAEPLEPAEAAEAAEPAEAAESAEPIDDDVDEEARRAAEEARREAEEAEAKAERALAELEELKQRFAYDRTGLFVGGGAFWAPEAFDDTGSTQVDNSKGAMGRLGYRVHSRIALDVRFDWIDDFDLRNQVAEGSLDGKAITGNVRFFFLTQRIQPWIGVGGGAIRTELNGRTRDGTQRIDDTETDAIFRFAGGFDVYMTPNLALTLEAAYATVAGDRDSVRYGQLGAGLDFRF